MANRVPNLNRFLRRQMIRFRDRFFPRHIFRAKVAEGLIPCEARDPVSRGIWLEAGFEEAERRFVGQLLQTPAVVFDVGANFGIYSLIAARANPANEIFSFEASPLEFRKLQWTVEWNHLTNVQPENVAVSDREGELTIYENLSGCGAMNRIDRVARPEEHHRATQVRCTTLDRFVELARLDRVDFVKIDVEGHECPVLRGARHLLTHFRPVMMIEADQKRAAADSGPAAILAMFRDSEGSWFLLDRTGMRLSEVPAAGLPFRGNWFFVPAIRRAELTRFISN